jgi:hypothetical protein
MANFFVRSRPTANRAQNTAMTLGQKVVATSSTAFLGILFEVTTAGTTANTAGDPAWNTTIGGTTTDGGVTWTTRGGAGIWLASKAYALGDRVCRVSQTSLNSASTCIWECTTAGTSNSTEPTWPTTITAGTTTQADNTVTWTARACTTWDNANPFLAGLLKDFSNSTIKVSAADSIYVSKTHAEAPISGSFQNLTLAFPGGGNALPTRLLCVDDTGQPSSPTTLATGATFTISGSFNSIILSGFSQYIYGCQFINNCSSSGIMQIPNTSSGTFILDNCVLSLANSGNTTGRIEIGSNQSGVACAKVTLNNVQFSFAHTSQVIRVQPGDLSWKNTASPLPGTAPTILFDLNNGTNAGFLTIEGVDFTALGANSLFGSTLGGVGTNRIQIKNCKLGASTALSTATNQGTGAPIIDMINCDSGGTNYKYKAYRPGGTIDHELTKIMTGGASDGTTGISWKIATNANMGYPFALESPEISTWNDNSGTSKTATVEILTDSASALKNDEIWLELRYLKNSGDPTAGFGNNSKSDVLQSSAAQPTSTATWTTTGITNIMKQKLQVSFTPGQKGPVTAVVKLAKASTTVYVNPVMAIA